MKKKITVTSIIIFFIILHASAAETLQRFDQWKHPDKVVYNIWDGKIDKDNELILQYGTGPLGLVSREKFTHFAPTGQAPSELQYCYNYFRYGTDFAFMELPDKIKIFTKKNGTYVWKETKWLKRGPGSIMPLDGLFFDGKLFFSGFHSADPNRKKGDDVYLVRVYDLKGNVLKNLIRKVYRDGNRLSQLIFHLVPYKTDRVFFIPANELKVSVIRAKELDVAREVPLQIPPFYKKMPAHFYFRESYGDRKHDLGRDIEEWEMGYSRITRCRIDQNYLVIQVRTCSPKMKKFALLFYNAETFKLENTIFTDDYLLDIADGKYYFFENGEPGRDDEAGDECMINIYKRVNKK